MLSLIVSSLSEGVLPCVIRRTTSKETWEEITENYSSTNPSGIMHVQNHFHNILKGIRSIASYVQDIW